MYSIFGVQRYDFDRAIEQAAIHHAASEDHFREGLDQCAQAAVFAGWSLERTLDELGRLYDIGYGEPEIEHPERKPMPQSAGVELQRRIGEGMR